MRNSKTMEAMVGGLVVLGIIGLIFLAYWVSTVNRVGGQGSYTVTAKFTSISGLKTGAAVTVAGVKIGHVTSIGVDPIEYKAKVTLTIDNQYNNIPMDSSISVLTQGLLGEKYVGLDMGADEVFLEEGDEFMFTKSAIVLERLVDQFFLKKTTQ